MEKTMKYFDKFLKKAEPIDIGLIKLSALFFGLFLAALFPALAGVNPGIWLIITIIIVIVKNVHIIIMKLLIIKYYVKKYVMHSVNVIVI